MSAIQIALTSFTCYLICLLCSIFMLAAIYLFIPAETFKTRIIWLNLILLNASTINFISGAYAAYYCFSSNVEVLTMVSFKRHVPLMLSLSLLFLASAVVRTTGEAVLWLRVKMVYPQRKAWHVWGITLICSRLSLELLGKSILAFWNQPGKNLLLAAMIHECFNNLLFSLLFLTRINLECYSKSAKKKLFVLRLIVLENALLPTLASLLAIFLGEFGVSLNGWTGLILLAYVVGIPAASLWTAQLNDLSGHRQVPTTTTTIILE